MTLPGCYLFCIWWWAQRRRVSEQFWALDQETNQRCLKTMLKRNGGGIKGFLNNVKKTAELLLGHPLNMDANLFPQCNVEYNVEGVHKQCQHRNRGHSASCSVHTFWLESISKSKSFLVAFPRKLSQGLRLREGFQKNGIFHDFCHCSDCSDCSDCRLWLLVGSDRHTDNGTNWAVLDS